MQHTQSPRPNPRPSSTHPSAASCDTPSRHAPTPTSGLADVVVADTRISEVDGQAGRLIIAGEELAQLAERGFEGACARLWESTPKHTAAALGAARVEVFAARRHWQGALQHPDPLSAVRLALAQLPLKPPLDSTPQAEERTRALLCGAMTVVLASWIARRHAPASAQAPLRAPDADASVAHDFLALAQQGQADEARARALDTYLCTVIDHGLNASTFAARVVASTGADLLSALLAALGALSGPLHGGAPGPVLDMLDAIGEEKNARAWLAAELQAGRRIMGMGHRVYRVRDPRAAVLQCALERLDAGSRRLALARVIEQQAEALLQLRYPERSLRANVEMYTALLLDGLGLHRDTFTATFAMARCAGWCAHYREQRAHGRLIRPRARYIGARPTADSSTEDRPSGAAMAGTTRQPVAK